MAVRRTGGESMEHETKSSLCKQQHNSVADRSGCPDGKWRRYSRACDIVRNMGSETIVYTYGASGLLSQKPAGVRRVRSMRLSGR